MEFNINRFFSLLKREFAIGKKNYINVIFILFLFGVANYGFTVESIESDFHRNFNDLFTSLIYVGYFAIVVQLFRGTEAKVKSTLGNNILLPSSSIEKYLLELIKVLIVIPILSTITIILIFLLKQYILVDYLGVLPKGFSYFLVLKYQFITYIYLIPFYSIVLYFSLFKSPVITIISLLFIILSVLLYTTLDQLIGGVIAGKTVFNILPYYGTKGFNTFLIIFEVGLFLFFQYLSYLRIKEREV